MRTFQLIALLLFMSLSSASAQVPTNTSAELFPLLPDAPSAVISDGASSPTLTYSRGDFSNVEGEVPSEPDLDQLAAPARRLNASFLIEPVVRPPKLETFQWESATRQSFLFLSVQHGLRLLQPKTRAQLDGPFFGDYVSSIKGIHGWGDGDGPVTNYILHPGEGGIASWIFIQNSPRARMLEFDSRSGDYWRSRLKAMGFAAAYSTQFEIGLYSEATIGNVGKTPGTSGWVDFVMTPVGGFVFTITEDAVDRHIIRKLENNGASDGRTRFLRTVLNPERSIANLLRLKAPWHRDTRPMPD